MTNLNIKNKEISVKPQRFHEHKDVVERARKLLPDDVHIFSMAELFSLVADPTKLKIMLALHDDEMCVCALADLLQVTESAVSHQLRLLKSLKIVEYRKEGRTVYYRLTDHANIHYVLDFCYAQNKVKQ